MTMVVMRCRLALSYYLAAALLLLAFLNAPLTRALPLPWQLCNATAGNYTEGSAYQANIRVLASAFPKNASASPALFAKGAAGTTPDVVYALALCRGDTNASSCAACVTAAFRNAQQLCAFNKRATMFDDPCILRYSDQDFLANVTDNRGKFLAANPNNVRAGAAAAFDAASGRLVTATAEHAAEDPSRRFGTGEEVYDETYPKIYSLAQCTPDMTEADCRSCLRDIIAKFTPDYFVGKRGCRVFGVRCNFRLETYSFFAGRPLLQLPGMLPAAPAPAATGEGHPQKKEISAGHGYSKTRIKIYTIAGSSSILMLLFAFWLGHKKYESKRKSKETAKIESFLQKHGTIHPIRYTYAQVKRMTRSFAEKLGQGGFGAVYRGGLSDGRQIAVKMLKDYKTDGEDFINEVASISRTSHVNVVTLLGFCLEGSKRALIYDYMPNGSLEKYAFKDGSKGGNTLGWEKLFDIAVGIARGLEYLHRGCNTRIVHFDIKPHNILLDHNFCPKISDFGLAKLCLNKESVISIGGARGTIGYIAPEVYSRQFGAVSSKSDVYSYGMMVLEMVGARDKNISPNSESSSQYFPQWIYEHLDEYCVSASEINGETSEIVRKMIVVGLWCIQLSSINRPTMTRVVEMLEGSTIGLELPPKVLLS